MAVRALAILTVALCSLPVVALDGDEQSIEVEHVSVSLIQEKQTLINASSKSHATQAKEADSGAASLLESTNGAGMEQAPATATPAPAPALSISAVIAEFIAMTLFVVIGCGSAMGIAKEPGSAWILQVSLTFGLAITSLAYAIGHYSGGQINCAVTLGLVIAGKCSIVQGILNFVGQMLGSVFGAFLLTMIYPQEKDRTGGLGTNAVGEGWSNTNALLGEVLMTFLLMFVVLETTSTAAAANSSLACVAIGLAVFLAHSVLIPIDGCSINPTRSFGPWLVANMHCKESPASQWVFWAGPLVGAAIGAVIHLGLTA